jgi:hypothetical protein
MDNVIYIKMMNGEEVIGKVKTEDEDTVTLEKPAIVMLVPNETGGVGVQMGPYSMLTDKPIAISKQALLFIAEPTSDLLNSYNANFGSGIIVPPKQGLITG